MSTEINEDEAVEIRPFSLDFSGNRDGILDLRPKVVMADPKENAVAHLEGQKTSAPIVDEIQNTPEPEQETLPMQPEQELVKPTPKSLNTTQNAQSQADSTQKSN